MRIDLFVFSFAIGGGLFLVASAIQRAAALISERVTQQQLALLGAQERFAIASIAGTLVGNQLSSPAYNTFMADHNKIRTELLTGGIKAVWGNDLAAADACEKYAQEAEEALRRADVFEPAAQARFLELARDLYYATGHVAGG
ncbi:MAG: hypothetical protein ABI779_26415 [Acidobacteriota bacterium]